MPWHGLITAMAVRKVGGVAIEAVSDTAGFEKDLEKGLKNAVHEAAKDSNWDPLVSAAGSAGERAGVHFTVRFKSKTSHEFETGELIDFRRLGTLFTKAGSNAADFFSKGFGFAGDVIGQLGKSGGLLSGLFSSLASVGSGGLLAGLGGFLITLGVLVVVVPLVTAAFFALGGVLVGLAGTLGALPALVTGLLVTFLPLIIAFQGFGDAIGALTSGDLEKFNETLKKLTPSAAGFAREIQRLMPFFTGLRKLVQEAFFAEILGSLEKFVTRAGPAISGGLAVVATALGDFAAGLLNLFSRRETVEFMARLFAAVSTGLTTATPVMIRFFGAFLSLANAALPVVSEFFTQVGTALDDFAAFLKGAAESGEFENFLRESFAILTEIGLVVKNLVVLAGVMFGDADTQQGAKAFLQDINRLLSEMTAWFRSEDGQRFLTNLSVLAEDFFDVLDTLVLPALRVMVGLIADALEGFRLIGEFTGSDKGPSRSGGRVLRLGAASAGGITQGPVVAGEAGTEAILPLDDPVRARQVASDPIVQNIIGGMGDTIVYAIFDGEPFQARIVRTAQAALAGTSRQLTQKPRTVLG